MAGDATRRELAGLIAAAHDPALAGEAQAVQIWNDGEITSQKGGDLLWRRTLHTLSPPLPGVSVAMPVVRDAGRGTSYAFVSEADARRIRGLMAGLGPA